MTAARRLRYAVSVVLTTTESAALDELVAWVRQRFGPRVRELALFGLYLCVWANLVVLSASYDKW